MVPTAVPTVRVTDLGVVAKGASRSRFLGTTGGIKHAKFLRSDGEGPHALANEYIANRMLQALGVERKGLVFVTLPSRAREVEPDLTAVTSLTGIGLDPLAPTLDLEGRMIAAAAERAPDAELLAQYIVLQWIQSNDHYGRNFLAFGGRVVAIDFAASPREERWRCSPFDGPEYDHGTLASRIQRVTPAVRESVLAAFDSVDSDVLRRVTREMPPDWATVDERSQMVVKLLSRKEDIRGRHVQ